MTFLDVCIYTSKWRGIPLECDNCHIGLNSHFIDLLYISAFVCVCMCVCVWIVLCVSGHVLICSKWRLGC